MFWDCSVWTCLSDLSTQIDGRQIKFYPYPKDKSLQERWKNVCKKVSHVKDNNFFRLCELHFEKRFITRDLRLKARAVPTIFDERRYPSKRKFQQTPQSAKRKSKGPPTKRIKEDANSSLELCPDSSLPNKKDKKQSQTSSVTTPSVNNFQNTSIDSKKIVRYRLVIDIDKVKSTVQKNGENQKSVVKHFSDASEKRKRKEEKEEEAEEEKEKDKEEKIIDKIETEDEENVEFFDSVPETNLNTKENLNDHQKEGTPEENSRFFGENSKNESYESSLLCSNTSFDDENYDAEYLTFSDDEDKLKPQNSSLRKEEEEAENLSDDEEKEFMLISDDNETMESNKKKLQTPPQQEDRKKHLLSNLQNLNKDHREKINKHDDKEEKDEEEEEMEAEYLIYSDHSETNKSIPEPRNNSQTLPIKTSNLPTNSTDKRCKNGCALEKITCDKNTQFRCINCNDIYNVTNKSNHELSNSIYSLDKQIEFIDHSTKLDLSESKVSMKLLAEHLIFTTNGNIQPCGGDCELTRIIYNNAQNYKCEKCGNIYKKSIDSAVQLPYSDDETVINFNDIFPNVDDDDDSRDDDVSSDFWDNDSTSDAVEFSKEDSSETEPLKENKKNHLNDKIITKSLTECKNGCEFTKNILNGGSIIKCIKCERNYELDDKKKLEIDLLKISNDVLEKYEDKLTKEENKDEKKIQKSKKRAKDLLKALQDKTRNVNDMMRVLKSSKEVSNLLKIRREKIGNTANFNNKLKNKDDLSNEGNKSKEKKNLLQTSNSEKEKKTEVPKDELKKKITNKETEETKMVEKNVSNSICQVNEIIDLEEENVENYPCDICDLPFETGDMMKDHIFTMHGIKPEVLLAPFETPDCKSISIENHPRPRIE